MKINVLRKCLYCNGHGYQYCRGRHSLDEMRLNMLLGNEQKYRIPCKYCAGTGKQLFESIDSNGEKVRYDKNNLLEKDI